MIMKKFKALITIIICLIIIINLSMYLSTQSLIDSHDDFQADCILILGAGVKNNQPSPVLARRLDKGIELYKQKYAKKMIMSGDHSRQTYNEVQVMKDYAVKQGVPSSDIILDHSGFSTYESMYRMKNVFHVQKIIIVTQEYHLYRALFIAKSFDIEAIGYSAKHPQKGAIMREAREIIARVKDFFTAFMKPSYTL